jgi:23S rRNA (uracil1939-C5)-methyltransferase
MAELDRKNSPPKAEIIRDLVIEKLVFQGYGLARKNKRVVFVANSVPGDILDAETHHRKADVVIARALNIHTPSTDRISPPCAVFGECGGCDWLMMPYEAQLKWKREILRELFRPLGVAPDRIPPVIPSPEPVHYRNKSYLPLAPGPMVGMYARRTHRVIPHQNCRIQPALFDEIARDVCAWITIAGATVYDPTTDRGALRYLGIRHAPESGDTVLTLVSRSLKLPFTKQLERCLADHPVTSGVLNYNPHPGNVILGEEDKLLWGDGRIRETIDGRVFQADYRSFFQVNTPQAANLHRFAAEFAAPGDAVLDAYCGVGTFGISLAGKVKSVVGVESNSSAVRDAIANAGANGLGNCEFLEGRVEDVLPNLLAERQIDLMIVDPPRSGLDRAIIPHLKKIPRIVYVSCNPATQIRDLRALIDAGFAIVRLQAFDMFPQTSHIESAVVLERKS